MNFDNNRKLKFLVRNLCLMCWITQKKTTSGCSKIMPMYIWFANLLSLFRNILWNMYTYCTVYIEPKLFGFYFIVERHFLTYTKNNLNCTFEFDNLSSLFRKLLWNVYILQRTQESTYMFFWHHFCINLKIVLMLEIKMPCTINSIKHNP